MTRSSIPLALALAAACTWAHAEPATYAIDPGHSSVTWEALHMNTSSLRGRFLVKEGSVTVDRAARTGKADITIEMVSLAGATVPAFDGALRSERGFNVAAFPTARFVSDSMTFDGDKVQSVPGTLTLLGKSQPVTLQAVRFNCYVNSMVKRETCGGDFETTISRSQFGFNLSPQGAADGVKLLIQVEAIKTQ